MFGCASAAAARASRSNRARSASGASSLTATLAAEVEIVSPPRPPTCRRRRGAASRRYRPAMTSLVHGGSVWLRVEELHPAPGGAGARPRARRAARVRARPARRARPAACSPSRPLPRSTCRRSRARRWTATPFARRTRPGTLPVVFRIAAGAPGAAAARARRGDGDRDRAASSRQAPTPWFSTSSSSRRTTSVEIPERCCHWKQHPPARARRRRRRGRRRRRRQARARADRGARPLPAWPSVVCARRPRVAVLTTGTELRPPG